MGRDGGDQDETASMILLLHVLNCELRCEVGSEDLEDIGSQGIDVRMLKHGSTQKKGEVSSTIIQHKKKRYRERRERERESGE